MLLMREGCYVQTVYIGLYTQRTLHRSMDACVLGKKRENVNHAQYYFRESWGLKIKGVYSWFTEKLRITAIPGVNCYMGSHCYLQPDTNERVPP